MNRDPWHRNRLIRDAIYKAISEKMAADPSIYLLGEGSHMKIHYDAPNIERDFPGRCITLPISEDANTNFAVGLSLAGVKPVVDVITSDFLFRTMDSICNTVTKTAFCGQPRTIVIRAEFMTGGPTTGQRLEALFAHVPGLNVVIPSNPRDAYALMLTALERPEATVFFEDRMITDASTRDWERLEHPANTRDGPRPFGRSFNTAYTRDGFHGRVTLASLEPIVKVVAYGLSARQVGVLCERTGTPCELIDLCTLYPLDMGTILEFVGETKRLLIVEPDVRFLGIGAEIAATVAEVLPGTKIRRLGSPRATLPACRELHERYVPSDQDILDAIESLLR